MNSKRVYYLMVGIICLLGVGLFASIYFGDKLLSAKSQKLVSLKLDNRVLEEQQTALSQANRDIEKYTELDKIAKTIVPQDKDQAKTVREIVRIAEQAGIKLSAINFPSSTLGQPTPKSSTTQDDAATNKKNNTSEPTKPATPATPPVTQVKPVDGMPGVYSMEIILQQDSTKPVPYSKFIDFLQRLEQNRRTAQVSSITVQPNAQDRTKLTFTLTVNVYIKP